MKAVAAALKRIYTAATIEEAERALDGFEAEWGGKYRAAVRVWRNAWPNVVPFFQFENWSLSLDVRILFLTVFRKLSGS